MWQVEYIIGTHAKKERIWTLWEDVRNWNKWNIGIEYSNINGNFEKGTYGSFKTVIMKKEFYYSFLLINCIQNKSFICRVKLFLCILDLGHEMSEENDILTIRHYITLNGLLTFYYKKRIGVNLFKILNKSVEKLIELAGK